MSPVTDISQNGSNILLDAVRDTAQGLANLFSTHHRELVELLRAPTPQKVSTSVVADINGVIGGGFASPNPITIYQCPVNQEALIHRLAISSPTGQPKSPITTGQAYLVDGSGALLFFLPIGGVVAPLQITEGFASAAHLNSGSKLMIYGDTFPAGTQLRFDLQIILTTGSSQYTPRRHPSEMVTVYD